MLLFPSLLVHMHKKFEINQTKIKGGCQSGRKVVPHNSKSDLPLDKLLHTRLNFIVLIIKSISNVDQNKLVTPGGKG